ncbi:MAG: TSUP family transporter, partial [Thalassobaculaceae bacterium]
SQVMPVMPYLLSLDLDPKRMMQTANCSFTLSSLVMVAGFSQIGLMTWRTALVSGVGLLAVYLGIRLGSVVRERLAPTLFRHMVLVMMVFLGAVMISRLVWSGA